MNQHSWDDRYRSSSRVFSGLPNPTLIAETTDLPAGRALDVGCGEGADAIWLAERGWQVTAIDIAPTALERAGRTQPEAARPVTWIPSDFARDPPPEGPFDLVTMHYVPLSKEDAHRIIPRLLGTVAAGGSLLFVTHDLEDLEAGPGFDPHLYARPEDIARQLGGDWDIVVDERRRRTREASRATKHRHDAVLHARRPADVSEDER